MYGEGVYGEGVYGEGVYGEGYPPSPYPPSPYPPSPYILITLGVSYLHQQAINFFFTMGVHNDLLEFQLAEMDWELLEGLMEVLAISLHHIILYGLLYCFIDSS